MTDLLPCPFCGSDHIILWSGYGTQADIMCEECCCDRSVQVADMREDGEPYPEFDDKTFRYPEWLIERTNNHLIAEWNTRAHLPSPPQTVGMREALFMCAASCQGGHSTAGKAAAEVLGVPYPIRLEQLVEKAIQEGLDPDKLWPWAMKNWEHRPASTLSRPERGGDK